MSGSISGRRRTVSRASSVANSRTAAGGSPASGHWSVKNVSIASLEIDMADLPLVENLQRRLAGAPPEIFFQAS